MMMEIQGDVENVDLGEGLSIESVSIIDHFLIKGPVTLPPHLENVERGVRRFDLVDGVPEPVGPVPGDCLFSASTGEALREGVTADRCE